LNPRGWCKWPAQFVLPAEKVNNSNNTTLIWKNHRKDMIDAVTSANDMTVSESTLGLSMPLQFFKEALVVMIQTAEMMTKDAASLRAGMVPEGVAPAATPEVQVPVEHAFSTQQALKQLRSKNLESFGTKLVKALQDLYKSIMLLQTTKHSDIRIQTTVAGLWSHAHTTVQTALGQAHSAKQVNYDFSSVDFKFDIDGPTIVGPASLMQKMYETAITNGEIKELPIWATVKAVRATQASAVPSQPSVASLRSEESAAFERGVAAGRAAVRDRAAQEASLTASLTHKVPSPSVRTTAQRVMTPRMCTVSATGLKVPTMSQAAELTHLFGSLQLNTRRNYSFECCPSVMQPSGVCPAGSADTCPLWHLCFICVKKDKSVDECLACKVFSCKNKKQG